VRRTPRTIAPSYSVTGCRSPVYSASKSMRFWSPAFCAQKCDRCRAQRPRMQGAGPDSVHEGEVPSRIASPHLCGVLCAPRRRRLLVASPDSYTMSENSQRVCRKRSCSVGPAPPGRRQLMKTGPSVGGSGWVHECGGADCHGRLRRTLLAHLMSCKGPSQAFRGCL